MKIDICIPTFHGIHSLQVAATGLRERLSHPEDVRILLYVQDPIEVGEAAKAFTANALRCEIVCTGPELRKKRECSSVDWMNALFQATSAPWVVMTEQDFFPLVRIDDLVNEVAGLGYLAAGPMDTFYFDHPNARKYPRYGTYARLCGEPGFFHSSLILLNREWFAAKASDPFSMPKNYVWWGQGVLGGEWYYGLRLHVGECRDKLAFFRQVHSAYGYGADIYWADRKLGVHTFYSSSDRMFGRDLNDKDREWTISENNRFLADYQKLLAL